MREMIIPCPGELAESLSDALLQAGALSVSVEDADLDTEAEQPLFGEPGTEPATQAWHRNLLVALLADGADPAQLLEMACSDVEISQDFTWTLREVPDADWVRQTQSQFAPIEVGQDMLIVPSWHPGDLQVAQQQGRLTIELDPGLAFGTGSHPTTHLCLQWLARCLSQGARVLDYGCGSGILAIAAAKLGASEVDAVDIDEQAVQSAADNARVNRVQIRAMLPDAVAPGQYDVVVANILSNPLKVLAPMLCARVRPAGHLVLSGVLERQAEEVAAAYAPWIIMSVWKAQDGWVCLVGQKEA